MCVHSKVVDHEPQTTSVRPGLTTRGAASGPAKTFGQQRQLNERTVLSSMSEDATDDQPSRSSNKSSPILLVDKRFVG